MLLGLHCPNFSWPGGATALAPTLSAVAETADQGGVHTLTLMDHYFQMIPLGGAPEPMLEGYTSLGYLAGRTERIELGLLVTGVTYRHPGLLAKIVTTLDVLSQGRAMLGIGAAWYEEEHQAFGVPFPPVAERFERLEETLQIVQQAFGDGGAFDGQHYRAGDLRLVPEPIQPRGPRILIGGSGERKTLRLVAQYADATNLFTGDGPDGVAHKLEVLRRHCDDVGRDYDEISQTIIASQSDPVGDTDAWLASMEAYAALGVEQVWVSAPADEPVAWTERLVTDVLPRLAQI